MVQRIFSTIVLTLLLSSLGHGQTSTALVHVPFQLPDHNPYETFSVPDFETDINLITQKYEKFKKTAESLGTSEEYNTIRLGSLKRAEADFNMITDPQKRLQVNVALVLGRAKHGDPFVTLGTTSEADIDTINKQFISIAKTINPDSTNDPQLKAFATEAMKELSQAKATIGNADMKKAWIEKNQGKYAQILLKSGVTPPSFLSKGFKGLKNFVKPMAMGNIGFTLGAAAQTCMAAKVFGEKDPALLWACADQLTSLQGWASLFVFSMGAEVSQPFQLIDYFKRHPEYPSNFGMVVGSQASHFFDKWANSDGFKKAGLGWGGLWRSTLHGWGEQAKKDNELHTQMAAELAIIQRESTDPAYKNGDEFKKAQADYNANKQKYEDSQKQLQTYRDQWFQGLDESFWETVTLKPGELKEIEINTSRMLAVSISLTIASHLYEGAWAKWALRNFDKVTKNLTAEQRTAFEAAQTLAAQQLSAFVQANPEAMNDVKALDTFMTRTQSMQEELQANLVKAAWKYQIYQKIAALGDDKLPKFLVMAKRPLKGTLKFFVPEVPEPLQLVGGLSRKTPLGEWGYGIAMSAFGAIKFLTLDQLVDGWSTNSWNAARLTDRLSSNLDPVMKNVHDFVKFDDSWYYQANFESAFGEFSKTWDEFRQNVILSDVNKHFATWSTHFKASQLEFYKGRHFLRWMLAGSKLDDPDFVKNGSDEDMPWHDDKVFAWKLDEDKAKYSKSVPGFDTNQINIALAVEKNEPGAPAKKDDRDASLRYLGWMRKMTEAYLSLEQSRVTRQDYTEATIMQNALGPIADKAYFNRQEPTYAKGVTAFYLFAKKAFQGMAGIGSMTAMAPNMNYVPPADPSLFVNQHQPVDSKVMTRPSTLLLNLVVPGLGTAPFFSQLLNQVGVPFNLQESYLTELVMIQQVCNKVLRQLPPTLYVVGVLSVCTDQYSGLNDITALAMSGATMTFANMELNLIPLDGSPRKPPHTREERANMVAAYFVGLMANTVNQVLVLPQKYKALLAPVQAPEPVQASENAQEDCAQALQTTVLDHNVDAFTKDDDSDN